ncbi:MAG: hypothetical protein ICV74_07060 [Thermoleophilia bacterium]|nr:hypothetical protein [Thermoleophilia bacterium]
MIDTHCHLLPGLDDGPRNLSESLALAHALEAEGVIAAVCTPHFSRQFPTSRDEAVERLRELRAELDSAGVALAITLAAEVSPGHVAALPEDELASRAIAGRYLLVEALPDATASVLETLVARVTGFGLAPVLAHPERSRAVQRHVSAVDSLRTEGALVQVVAPSLVGRWGEEVAAAAWRLVDTGRADLLASDAHGARRRRVHLREATALVRRRLGDGVAAEITEERPTRVVRGLEPG